MPRNKYKFDVEPEKFDRPKDLDGLRRIYHYLNLASIARKLPSCNAPSTLISRFNRGTRLDDTVPRKAFAQDVGDFFNEMFWELGVWLGHFPNDPRKKYRFLYENESEKLEDELDKFEAKRK